MALYPDKTLPASLLNDFKTKLRLVVVDMEPRPYFSGPSHSDYHAGERMLNVKPMTFL